MSTYWPVFAMTFATFWIGWLFGFIFGSTRPIRSKAKEDKQNG